MSQSLTNILSHGVYQIVWPHCSKDNCCTSTRPSQSAGSCPFPPGLWLQTPTWRVLQIQTKVLTKIVALRTSKPFHHATFLTCEWELVKNKTNFDIKGVQPRSRMCRLCILCLLCRMRIMCILCILCLMCRSRILRIYYADQILQWCCQEASFSSLHYVVGKSKTSQSKPFMKHRFVFISKPPSW